MGLHAVKVLGISINSDSKEIILEYLRKYLVNSIQLTSKKAENLQKPLTIVTPNPEQVVYAQKNLWFANMLNQADLSLPDGIGLVWASRIKLGTQNQELRTVIKERISGVELMEDLVSLAVKEGYRIGLIGGRAGIAVKALECLQKKHPGLVGWATDGPEVKMSNYDLRFMIDKKENISDLARKIRTNHTSIVFVGMGAPKQEYFIHSLANILGSNKKNIAGSLWSVAGRNLKSYKPPATSSKLILMSVGGAFDMIAGKTVRAPNWIRQLGLEWLWRLILEPWRFRRQLALLKFVWMVMVEKVRI